MGTYDTLVFTPIHTLRMGIKRVEIVLDKVPHVFYAGDTLEGRIELHTLEPLKIKGKLAGM